METFKPMRYFTFFILFFLIIGLNPAHAKKDYRCGVRLIFDSDGSGSVANYARFMLMFLWAVMQHCYHR